MRARGRAAGEQAGQELGLVVAGLPGLGVWIGVKV